MKVKFALAFLSVLTFAFSDAVNAAPLGPAWEVQPRENVSEATQSPLGGGKTLTAELSVLRFSDRCMRWLTPDERSSPELREAVERYHRECPSCQIQVKCDECKDPNQQGFFRSRDRCGTITLCTNNTDRFVETLIHELTHARRYCVYGESVTCKDNLCDELVAYQETGQCSLETPLKPSDGDFYQNPRERYLCCVQACGSVGNQTSCHWSDFPAVTPERLRELFPDILPGREFYTPCQSACLNMVETGQCYLQGDHGDGEPCYADDGTGKTFHPLGDTPLDESYCEELCEVRFKDLFLRGEYWLIPIGCTQRLCRLYKSAAAVCAPYDALRKEVRGK